MMHAVANSLLFATTISLATFCGLGLLEICGLRGLQQRILIAPTMFIAVSGIAVGLIVVLGTPIEAASPFLWLFWGVFAAYGMLRFRSALADLDHPSILWTAVLATAVVLGGFLWYGLSDYLGSPALDGWSYVSFGEYLRRYPKGVEGGLPAIYQYAAHLSGTRYVASAMLAALIPPWVGGIDTQMTVGPLLVLSVFSFATSMGYVAKLLTHTDLASFPILAMILATVGGWVPFALHVNNYDNLLALPFATALFSLGADRTLSSQRGIVPVGILIGATIYIYPELSPLIALAFIAGGLEGRFASDKREGQARAANLLYGYAGTALVALLVVSPYLRDALRFFGQQLASTAQIGGRPGEGMMPSLLDGTRIWGAMWGLGSSDLARTVGLCLIPIAIAGVRDVVVRKHFGLASYLSVLSALFLVMVTIKQYDYGAYKALLLAWWAVAIILANGVATLWRVAWITRALDRPIKAGIVVVLFGAAALWVAQQYRWVDGYRLKTALETRQARDVVANHKGAVQVSVSDPTFNAWLVYQLRNVNALFTEFHGYMDQAHVRPLMARSSAPALGEIQYVLTESARPTTGEVVWKTDNLKIVRSGFLAELPELTVEAPNGREVLDGIPFFWLGREPASVVLKTSKGAVARLKFRAVVGPSVGVTSPELYPKLSVEQAGRQLLYIDPEASATYTLRLTLLPGSSVLIFRSDYSGSIVPNKNADPRTLLVGIGIVGWDLGIE